MKRAPCTRAERESTNRAFAEAFLLPAIGRAVRGAGLRGDVAFSAALGEVENCRLLWHLLPRNRAATREPK
jgi:hypothetical protein